MLEGLSEESEENIAFSKLNIPYTISEIIVAIASIIGNTLVILAFKRERKLRRRTNYYIISLAMADLLVGLVGIPCAILTSVGLPKHLHACLFTVSLLVVLCTISIFSLVAVSVDRYWAILYPMSYSTHINSKVTLGIIGICWIMGCLIGFLPLLGWNATPAKPLECIFTKVMNYDYLVFLYFTTIIFPAILLAVFYTHIYGVILKQLRQMVLMNECGNFGNQNTVSLRILGEARKKEVKATQNLSIIVLFFIVCWIPLYTINCIQAFCSNCSIPDTLTDLCIILTHLNSAGNPLLYAYHLSDFRSALHSLLTGTPVEEKPIPLRENISSHSADLKHRKLFNLSTNASKFNFNKKPNKLFLFHPKVETTSYSFKYTNPSKNDIDDSSKNCLTADVNKVDNNENYCTFDKNNTDNTGKTIIGHYSEIENNANNYDTLVERDNSRDNANSYGYISINESSCYNNHLFVPDDLSNKSKCNKRRKISEENSYIVITEMLK